MHVYACVCMYIYIYICMYVYIYIHHSMEWFGRISICDECCTVSMYHVWSREIVFILLLVDLDTVTAIIIGAIIMIMLPIILSIISIEMMISMGHIILEIYENTEILEMIVLRYSKYSSTFIGGQIFQPACLNKTPWPKKRAGTGPFRSLVHCFPVLISIYPAW